MPILYSCNTASFDTPFQLLFIFKGKKVEFDFHFGDDVTPGLHVPVFGYCTDILFLLDSKYLHLNQL